MPSEVSFDDMQEERERNCTRSCLVLSPMTDSLDLVLDVDALQKPIVRSAACRCVDAIIPALHHNTFPALNDSSTRGLSDPRLTYRDNDRTETPKLK